jgi:hypothetical protein
MLNLVLHGSCLCGGVKFHTSGPLNGAVYCHCSMCRKAHGSAFRARAKILAKDFHWLQGESLVTYYQSSPGTLRGFCSVCGSNLINRFDADPFTYGLALGVLDDDPRIRPQAHVYVKSKAPWHEITDALPQFETVPTKR